MVTLTPVARRNRSRSWRGSEICELTPESFESLLHNEIAAVKIPLFASVDECEYLATSIEAFGFDYYENVSPPIGRIGITQFEHRHAKEKYFDSVEAARRKQIIAFGSGIQPLARMQEYLLAVYPGRCYIAFEHEIRSSYFAGLIRQINTALLHVDWAPLDASGWDIGRVLSQLAWNLFVRAPESGGECIVHDRLWRPDDQKLLIPGSYGYDHSVVVAHDNIAIRPTVGDVYLFNSQNFHQVQPGGTPGERLTISSFIGLMPDGDLVLWS